MTAGGRTTLGVVLMLIGILLGLIGLLVGWNSLQRWLAVNEVKDAQSLIIHAGRLEEARRVASVAWSRVPDSATAALIATDLADPSGVERLVNLAALNRNHDERQTLLAAAGLSRALAGKPTEVDLEGTGDGRMIAAIVAIKAGREPAKLSGSEEDPPHIAVERAAMTVLARKSWEEGRAEDMRRYAGALVLLDPRPQAHDIQIADLVLAAVNTASKARSVDVLRIAGELPASERGAILRAIVALVPERRSLLETQYAKDLEVPK